VPARLWVVRKVGIPQGLPLTFSRPSFSSIDDPERQDTAEAGDIDAFPRVFPLSASFGALQRSSFCRLAERKAGTRTRLARIGLSLIITYVALHAAETLLSLAGLERMSSDAYQAFNRA
jgi:hypothetical protein